MSTKRLKQYSMLLLAIGVIAVSLSGGGTFATFNAQVANRNNTFATGTLYLHETATNTCTSESSSSNANWGVGGAAHIGDACDILFSGINPQGYDKLGLNMKNAGTLNGIGLDLALGNTSDGFAQTGCVSNQDWTTSLGTVSLINGTDATEPNGNAVTEIDLNSPGLPVALDANAPIQVLNGEGQAETFYTNVDEPIGATAIPVGANFGPTTVTTAGDLDTGDLVSLTEGSVLKINGSAGPIAASTPVTSIQLVAPLQVSLYSGAVIEVTEAGNQAKTMLLTTTAVYSAGFSGTMSVTGNTGAGTAFAAGDSVYYSPVFGGGSPAICDDLRLQVLEVASPSDYSDITFNPSTGVSTDSDSTFLSSCALGTPDNITHGCSAGVGLDSVSPPAAGYLHNEPTFTDGTLSFGDLSTLYGPPWDNGTNPRDPGTATGLDAGTHRYIVLILYLQPPTSNSAQGQIGTFDLVWNMNQAS